MRPENMPTFNGNAGGNGDRRGDQPRYRHIFELLRSQIWQGVYPPGKKLPTEAELMQHFEVSRTTVSRAMRDLEQMGLVDRCRGSGTYVKQNGGNDQVVRLSFLVPWVDSNDRLPYVEGLIYQRIARLAGENGVSIALHCFDASCHDLRSGMHKAAQKVIDDGINGVMYYPAELPKDKVHINREIVDKITGAGIKVVLVDRDITPYPDRSEFIRIGFDNRRGGMILTNHMIAQGCKRIAFIGIPEDSTAVADRLQGYYEAHSQQELTISPELVCAVHEDDLDLNFGRHLLKEVRPDAIIAKMDRFAAILGRHLSFLGVQIGSDIKLAGFDNDPISELLHMSLTTIGLPVEPFADAAFRAMLQCLDEEDYEKRQIIIDTELIVRDSTCPASDLGPSTEAISLQ